MDGPTEKTDKKWMNNPHRELRFSDHTHDDQKDDDSDISVEDGIDVATPESSSRGNKCPIEGANIISKLFMW